MRGIRGSVIHNCKKCGACCHMTISLGLEDVTKWAEERDVEILKQVCWLTDDKKEAPLLLAFKPTEGKCPFLNAQNMCDIYEHRPKVCREFPRCHPEACPNVLKNSITQRDLKVQGIYEHIRTLKNCEVRGNQAKINAMVARARRRDAGV